MGGVSLKDVYITQNAMDLIDDGIIHLVINVSREFDESGRPDGFFIRRRAAESGISLITDLQLTRSIVEALRYYKPDSLSWRIGATMYMETRTPRVWVKQTQYCQKSRVI